MPLVRIDLPQGKPAEYRRSVTDVIYAAIVGVLNAPKDDRFMVVTEHPADGLDIDPGYLGSLIEVKKENWSFGNGEAQYAS